MLCRMSPSGVPWEGSGLPGGGGAEAKSESLKPGIGCQVSPASSERKSAGGDVPAYQTSGSSSREGVSQKT